MSKMGYGSGGTNQEQIDRFLKFRQDKGEAVGYGGSINEFVAHLDKAKQEEIAQMQKNKDRYVELEKVVGNQATAYMLLEKQIRDTTNKIKGLTPKQAKAASEKMGKGVSRKKELKLELEAAEKKKSDLRAKVAKKNVRLQ